MIKRKLRVDICSILFFFYAYSCSVYGIILLGDSMNIIFHIDVNNAFLSWTALELLNHGSGYDIRNSYAVVGGDESRRHGIVLAKSMPAKKMGVKTGESLFEARKKCPALRTYPPNYEWYQQNSKALFELLSKYSPDIEVASIDECYMDYGKVKKLYGDEVAFAYKLKDEIKKTLGFTVNIGIANNKLCAKMASDFSKPDKVHTLYMNEVSEKMWPLPIGELYGIGKRSTEKLLNMGIRTIYDLAHMDSGKLYPYFKNQSVKMIESANGISHSIVTSNIEEPKGIGNSTTLSKDMDNPEEIKHVLHAIADNVGRSLRKQKKYASVVAVQLKDKYFRSYSHQKTLDNATNITSEIYKTSVSLFEDMWDHKPVRLIGIRLDHLSDTVVHQVSLFESLESREKDNELDQIVDEMNEKFGSSVIKKASLIDSKIKKKVSVKSSGDF